MQDERIDGLILGLLTEEPGPWKAAEIEQRYGRTAAVADSLGRLEAMGFIHRIEGGFVFSSDAGRYAHRLDPTWPL